MPLNKEEIRILEEDGWEVVCESPLEFEKSVGGKVLAFLYTEESQRLELSNIIHNTQTSEEDINYFKKKLLYGVADENWDSVLVAAKRLKLLEESLIIYRLTRSPEKNILHYPKERFLIKISPRFDGIPTRWLQNDKWMLSSAYADEFHTKVIALNRIEEGLPDIPNGYGEPSVEEFPTDEEE